MINYLSLNARLAHTPYLAGFRPTAEDAAAFSRLLGAGVLHVCEGADWSKAHPHLARWVRHMRGVPQGERQGWR